jgi:Uma2 family endonuclease
MLVELNRIVVPPGERLLLRDVDWAELENILVALGEHRSSRIAYHKGTLEIMSPLPEHELSKDFVTDMVKILLIEWDIIAYPLGSTTFKKQAMEAGIEPDQCFYINNAAAVQGKKRLDMDIDPPPDLAIEIDVTSRTHPEIYAKLGVRELWRLRREQLEINHLQNGVYVVATESQFFPGVPLPERVAIFFEQARHESWNAAYKSFRDWARLNAPN